MMVAAAKLFMLVAANIQLKRSERIERDGFILFGVSVGFYSGLTLNQYGKARQRRTGLKLIHYNIG